MQITGKYKFLSVLLAVIAVICVSAIIAKNNGNQSAEGALCKDCNIILLSIDSLRADHVSALGYNRNTTPNFDALASNGALFLNYFSASFLTPVSEMSVHTGLYPTSNGVTNFDTVLPENRLTIASYLKSSGYKTSALMSSPEFIVNPALKESFSRGFDSFEKSFNSEKPGLNDFRQTLSPEKLSSALDKLKDKKFFLWLPVGTVHWPYGIGVKNVYADPAYSGIFKGKVLHWDTFKSVYGGKMYPAGTKLRPEDTAYVMDQYDNGVRAFDDFLGQLLSQLNDKGLSKKTILVIESEHGEDLGEHGYFAHYDVMDTQTHTPLLIFIPTVKNGSRISSFSGSVDVLPTILELIGKNIPESIQGKSLAPIIAGKEKDGIRREAFLERVPLWEEANTAIRSLVLESAGLKVVSGVYKDIAVRTPEWKYILRTSQKRMEKISWWQWMTGKAINFPDAELYDIAKDPLETKNVIKEYPNEAKILRTRLETWFAEISSSTPQGIEHKEEIQPYF